MQICKFVRTGKSYLHAYLWAYLYANLQAYQMQICKPIRCKSVSYLYHILKGIKYISVQTSSISGSCPDCVLIQGFKMWSKLPTYPEREGTSSWSRWPSRNVSSNCAVHIKMNVCIADRHFLMHVGQALGFSVTTYHLRLKSVVTWYAIHILKVITALDILLLEIRVFWE